MNMKKKNLLLVITLMLTFYQGFAQAPNGINYQAVVRTSNGSLVQNQSIELKFVLSRTINNLVDQVYEEVHNVTTNDYGLVNLVLGNGQNSSGDFSSIDWSQGEYYIETYKDGVLFTSQNLQSVPFALFSNKSGSEIDSIADNGDGTLTFHFVHGGSYTSGVLSGIQGPVGNDGADGVDGVDGLPGSDGADGASAYEVWLNQGNTGTEQDFLNSLQGPSGNDGADGVDGVDGLPGLDGADGASAYEVWLNQGNTGTEQDFLNSLQGPAGNDGADGVDGQGGVSVAGTNVTITGVGTPLDPYVISSSDNVDDSDNNPTNEIQDIATDGSAGNVSISDGSTISINVNDADNNPANEITTVIDNGNGTTTITDVLGGTVTVDNDGIDDVDDADNNPTNEIQDISTDGSAGNVSISDGSTISINVNDADNNPANEITTVIDNGNGTTTITDVLGGSVTVDNDGIDDVDDADNVVGNEYNTGAGLLPGNILEITDGGGALNVDLSVLQDGDWFKSTGNEIPTLITDNIYTEGQVGIGTNLYGGKFKIDMDGGSTNEQTIEFSLPGSPTGTGVTTGMVFNSANSGDYSRFDIFNQHNSIESERFFGLKFNGQSERGLYIRKGGNVGIGTPVPDKKLVSYDHNGDVSSVTTLLSLQKTLNAPSAISSGVGVGIEFESAANGEDPIVLRGIGEINAIFKDASGGSNSNRNGFFKFETYHHGYKYNRMELLGSGNGMANGSPTLHYSSPILRLIYDTYMSSNSLIGSGFDLGSLEFYGKMGSNSGVGAKIVAATSEQWGGSVDDYPSELQFHTTSNGTTTGLTQRMVISSEGSVGIGTNTPLKPLELSGDDPDFRQNILSTSSANLVEHEFTVDNSIQSSLYFSKADNSFTMRNKTSGSLHLGTDNSNDLSIATGGAVTISDLAGVGSRMVVTDANGQLSTSALPVSSETDPQVGTNTLNYIPKWNGSNLTTGSIYDNGNVGINTTSPGFNLDVNGTMATNYLFPRSGDGTQYRFLRFGSPSEFYSGLMWNNNSPSYGDGDDFTIFTYDNRDIALVPHGSGSVKVHNSNLDVKGNFITQNSAIIGGTAIDASATLKVNGNIKSSGIDELSDFRWKKDIVQIENALNKVLSMRGVYYNWKIEEFPENNFTKKHQIGFIAQELEDILPEVVNTDDKGYKSVMYSHVVPLLIEAIKELKDEIDVKNKTIDLQGELIKANREEIDLIKTKLESIYTISKRK